MHCGNAKTQAIKLSSILNQFSQSVWRCREHEILEFCVKYIETRLWQFVVTEQNSIKSLLLYSILKIDTTDEVSSKSNCYTFVKTRIIKICLNSMNKIQLSQTNISIHSLTNLDTKCIIVSRTDYLCEIAFQLNGAPRGCNVFFTKKGNII